MDSLEERSSLKFISYRSADNFFMGSTDLSIICFTKQGITDSFFPQTKSFYFKLDCFEKALAILFVLIFHYSAQSVLDSASTSLKDSDFSLTI